MRWGLKGWHGEGSDEEERETWYLHLSLHHPAVPWSACQPGWCCRGESYSFTSIMYTWLPSFSPCMARLHISWRGRILWVHMSSWHGPESLYLSLRPPGRFSLHPHQPINIFMSPNSLYSLCVFVCCFTSHEVPHFLNRLVLRFERDFGLFRSKDIVTAKTHKSFKRKPDDTNMDVSIPLAFATSDKKKKYFLCQLLTSTSLSLQVNR